MGIFGKKPKPLYESGLLKGMTDVHCHLLPGVDDGVQHMKETLEILARYEELGIVEVWCTPHIMEDVPNRPEDLRRRFEELCAEYKGSIKLHLAAENMMDSLFQQRLDEKNLLVHSGDSLLVETSYYNPPAGMNQTLERIKSYGLFPILAHPERYLYMEMKDYAKLVDRNIRLQVNLGSLAGIYGKVVQKRAEWILEHGLYTYAGTDCHSRHMLAAILEGRLKSIPGNNN